MITITTKKGIVIACDAVTPGAQYPVLHIHTHALSGADAFSIFSDPEQTEELTETRAVDGKEETRVFTGFTALYSVGKSPFISGALLIWLNRTI